MVIVSLVTQTVTPSFRDQTAELMGNKHWNDSGQLPQPEEKGN